MKQVRSFVMVSGAVVMVGVVGDAVLVTHSLFGLIFRVLLDVQIEFVALVKEGI
jgi:hypothetical protein